VAMLRAADQKPGDNTLKSGGDGAKPQFDGAHREQAAAKPETALEQNLKWGEPVNGLRAAVALRPASSAKAGEAPELYVAVQNVSEAPIHVNDTLAQEQPRMLYLKSDGRIQMGMGAKDPRFGDLTLQPRQIAFVPMFPDTKMKSPLDRTVDGHTTGQVIAEGAMKDTHQSLVVHMIIEKAPAGAWTGKLITGDSTAATAAGQPHPKDKDAQALFNLWRHQVRGNGDFPGGLVERLGEKVKEFVKVNTPDAAGAPYAKKMAPLIGRFDGSRDWKPAEVASLMDDIAAVSSGPLSAAVDEIEQHTFRTGAPLPNSLTSAPWGAVQPSGLRMAWLIEPRTAEHPLGSALKSRILIQNLGKDQVVFRTRTWHQGVHSARDANGAEIKVEATSWLTRAPLMPFRLWPGEYVELTATGIGIGTHKNENEDWQNARVGSWIEAKAGDDVTVTTGPVPLNDWNPAAANNGEPGWWLDLIKTKLDQNLPLPADEEERRRLVYRAGMEIFGTPLTKDEIAAFVSDHDASALDALAHRLAKRAGTTPFSGDLTSAPTQFKVLPPDPDAAKRPRAASNPGDKPILDALHGAIAPPEAPTAPPAATASPK
jgi:hypothetical protein